MNADYLHIAVDAFLSVVIALVGYIAHGFEARINRLEQLLMEKKKSKSFHGFY